MRTLLAPLLLIPCGFFLHAQDLSEQTVVVSTATVAHGPHERVVEVVRHVSRAGAEATTLTNHFTELGTGLGRLDPQSGSYVPAVAEFRQTADGFFIADQTAHQVILSPQLNCASSWTCSRAGRSRSGRCWR